MTIYVRSINMFDMNMAPIAEFMIMEDPAMANRPWVKAIPNYNLYEIYRLHPESITVNSLTAGMHMTQESFLAYIGNAANEGSKLPYPYTMAYQDITVALTTGVSLAKICQLTGWDEEFVSEFYKDYLVFG